MMSGDCHRQSKLSRRSVLHLIASPIALMIAREVQAESEQRAGEVADVKGEAFAREEFGAARSRARITAVYP